MNGSKKTPTGAVVNVPVQRVSLGSTGQPNADAFTEEDKEILGNFSVPLGNTSGKPPDKDPKAAKLAALAKARAVKSQKISQTNAAAQKSEPNPSDTGVTFDDDNDDSLIQTDPPIMDKTPALPDKPDVPEPRTDSPPIISPERKRRILQMLADLPSDEDEEEEGPPTKKHKSSSPATKTNSWRDFAADKALDFGRFVAATTVTAIIVGTVKTMGSGLGPGSQNFEMNPDWIRQ